jgi:GTP-binding protein YchF
MLSIGIVGLPNIGKSTLFNVLTKSRKADCQNYPFCTIEPNIGVVEVPDKRLQKLSDISLSEKVIPTAIEFVDIAGLVKGASKGEGLGNKFLANIREVDAIAHVLRTFEDKNIIHVSDKLELKKDLEIINLELILADIQTINKRIETKKKSRDKESIKELEILEKILKILESEKLANEIEWKEEELKILKELHLLTLKPMIYVINCDEKQINNEEFNIQLKNILGSFPFVKISAKLEEELSQLSEKESKEYLNELGIGETGFDKLIVKGYEILNLITFFTSGKPETRAWTIKKGTKAPQAAGVIHSDFIKGFIKAEVADWNDFVEFNGWNKLKEKGKIRLEGKEYIVKDGDVCFFHVRT